MLSGKNHFTSVTYAVSSEGMSGTPTRYGTQTASERQESRKSIGSFCQIFSQNTRKCSCCTSVRAHLGREATRRAAGEAPESQTLFQIMDIQMIIDRFIASASRSVSDECRRSLLSIQLFDWLQPLQTAC